MKEYEYASKQIAYGGDIDPEKRPVCRQAEQTFDRMPTIVFNYVTDRAVSTRTPSRT